MPDVFLKTSKTAVRKYTPISELSVRSQLVRLLKRKDKFSREYTGGTPYNKVYQINSSSLFIALEEKFDVTFDWTEKNVRSSKHALGLRSNLDHVQFKKTHYVGDDAHSFIDQLADMDEAGIITFSEALSVYNGIIKSRKQARKAA